MHGTVHHWCRLSRAHWLVPACSVLLLAGPADGEPLLLVHGFGASVGHWRKNMPAFAAKGYRTYAIDLLGFGGSDKPKEVSNSHYI